MRIYLASLLVECILDSQLLYEGIVKTSYFCFLSKAFLVAIARLLARTAETRVAQGLTINSAISGKSSSLFVTSFCTFLADFVEVTSSALRLMPLLPEEGFPNELTILEIQSFLATVETFLPLPA